MSRQEWENGTLKLSAAQFRTLRNGLMDAYNEFNGYEEANTVYEELMRLGKGKRKFDYKTEFKRLTEESGKSYPVSLLIKENGKPRRPLKKDFPIANRKTDYYDVGSYGTIDLSFEPTGVHWGVAKGEDAVVKARATVIGKVFFAILDELEWSTRTGGVVMANYEGNVDEDGQPAKSNVTGTYGNGKVRENQPVSNTVSE